jgi:hypothetical protein
MAFPATLPVFADSEITDPTSGQLNTAEPTGSYLTEGFGFTEIPSRQHKNYLLRWIFRWLKYIKDTFVNLESGTVAARLYCGTGFTSLGADSEGELVSGFINFNLPWLVMNNHLLLKIPNVYGSNLDTSGLILQILDADLEFFKWKKAIYVPGVALKAGAAFVEMIWGDEDHQSYLYTATLNFSTGENGLMRQVITLPIYDS